MSCRIKPRIIHSMDDGHIPSLRPLFSAAEAAVAREGTRHSAPGETSGQPMGPGSAIQVAVSRAGEAPSARRSAGLTARRYDRLSVDACFALHFLPAPTEADEQDHAVAVWARPCMPMFWGA